MDSIPDLLSFLPSRDVAGSSIGIHSVRCPKSVYPEFGECMVTRRCLPDIKRGFFWWGRGHRSNCCAAVMHLSNPAEKIDSINASRRHSLFVQTIKPGLHLQHGKLPWSVTLLALGNRQASALSACSSVAFIFLISYQKRF
jgi:hypothetical protein